MIVTKNRQCGTGDTPIISRSSAADVEGCGWRSFRSHSEYSHAEKSHSAITATHSILDSRILQPPTINHRGAPHETVINLSHYLRAAHFQYECSGSFNQPAHFHGPSVPWTIDPYHTPDVSCLMLLCVPVFDAKITHSVPFEAWIVRRW